MTAHSVTPLRSSAVRGPLEMGSRRFVIALIACLLASAIAIGVFNAVVDPYGLLRWIEIPGFNVRKPRASQAGEAFKYRAVSLLAPSTLLIGNSRVEMGWDPSSLPASRFGTTVNVGLPGKGLDAMRPLLDHAWQTSRPGNLLIGVDFMDCLRPGRTAPEAHQAPAPALKSAWAAPAGSPLEQLRTRLARLMSFLNLETALDSIVTVASQHRAGAAHLRADGFNPAPDYEVSVRIDGPKKMFAQREAEVVRTRFRTRQSIRAADGTLSPCFAEIDALLRDAGERRQSVWIATYPYHARLLEVLWQADVWREFEDWKRELAAIIARARAQGLQVAARDFSSYHAYATEPLDGRADSRTGLQWYWEAGHFKAPLGDRMLRIMTGQAPPEGTFGAEITPSSLEAGLAAIRAEGAAFTRAHPEVAQNIQRVIQAASR